MSIEAAALGLASGSSNQKSNLVSAHINQIHCEVCGAFICLSSKKAIAICNTEECKNKLIKFIETNLSNQ